MSEVVTRTKKDKEILEILYSVAESTEYPEVRRIMRSAARYMEEAAREKRERRLILWGGLAVLFLLVYRLFSQLTALAF